MPSAGGIFRIDPPPVQGVRFVPIAAPGDAPPATGNQRDIDLFSETVAIAWTPPDPLPTIPQRSYIAPLTLTYGNQPPVIGPVSLPDEYAIRGTWEPPPPLPTIPQRGYIVPLTLAYGQQPPRYATRQRWQTEESPQPQRPGTAAWNVVLITQPPFTPLPMTIIAAWQLEATARQQDRKIAPLTLVYGQQPQPWSTVELTDLVAAWQPADPQPQPRVGTAAWNVPLIVQPPRSAFPFSVIGAWQDGPATAQPTKKIAPLTLTYGQQPPRYSVVVVSELVASWIAQPPQPPELLSAPIPRVDNPPAYSSANFLSIVGTWITEPVPRQRLSRFIPPTVIETLVRNVYALNGPALSYELVGVNILPHKLSGSQTSPYIIVGPDSDDDDLNAPEGPHELQ